MTTTNAALRDWVADVATLTRPDRIQWCDGSQSERDALIELMLARGDLITLNQDTHPHCYLHRSHPSDVARVEHLTFICTSNRDDAGPNNNWMDPAEAHRKIDALFKGCMKGRTLYVVPYCMGPIDSPYSRCGVEITDSAYVVINMAIMTRMGAPALERIARDGKFVKGLHSIGELDPESPLHHAFPRRAFDQELRLGLRRQRVARQEMPRVAHRELAGARRRLAGRAHAHRRHRESRRARPTTSQRAFPSACGKTNLAMLIPPRLHAGLEGLDRRRRHRLAASGADGRLYAINPEVGLLRRRAGHQPRRPTATPST